ncbi:MAG: hypothetical protein OXL34_02265 [Gemmatimonadota bacterium]|nr:hypothetical protein [Gemmatimonadota bacterium]
MTKKTTAALRRPMIVAAGLVAVAGCQSLPRMLSRPVAVQAGGFDCVGATLVELGYTITDGDRATGFIRGERQRRGGFFSSSSRVTDILMVSETTSEGSERQLNVTVSRIDDNESGTEGPSDKGLANAEQLLERCAGVSGEVRARRAVTELGFAVPLSRRLGEPAPVPT